MKLFRNKLFLFALVLVILCGGIMLYAASHRGTPTPLSNLLGIVVSPLEKGVSAVAGKLSDFFGYFYRYDALKAENAELKARIAKYEELETEFHSAISENSDLRKARAGPKNARTCSMCARSSAGSLMRKGRSR